MGYFNILEGLLKLVPPPPTIEYSDADWAKAESQLGLPLPRAYKALINAYGDFYWGEFLHLLNPFSEQKYLNFHYQVRVTLDADQESRKLFPEHYPLPLYPESGGLLPFFGTDNGDTGYWITQGDANEWPILLRGARAPEFEVHFQSCDLFLYHFINGTFQSIIFPSD